jgi:hypothetical protein
METIGEVVLGERVSVSLIGRRRRLGHQNRLILAVDYSPGGGRRGSLQLLVQRLVDPLLPIDHLSHIRPRPTHPSLPIHLLLHHQKNKTLSFSRTISLSSKTTCRFRQLKPKNPTVRKIRVSQNLVGFSLTVREREREREMGIGVNN